MRALIEIQKEFGDLCAKVGAINFQRETLKVQVAGMMARMVELEKEAHARQLVDASLAAEKAAEAQKAEAPAEKAEEVVA